MFSFDPINIDNFEEAYSSLSPFKNLVIGCINELIELDNLSSFIQELFEDINEINSKNKNAARWKYMMFKILIHEIIISIVAIMYKNRKYTQIFYLITASYLARDEWERNVNFHNFSILLKKEKFIHLIII